MLPFFSFELDGVIVVAAMLLHGSIGSTLPLLGAESIIPMSVVSAVLLVTLLVVNLLAACYVIGGVLLTNLFEWRSAARPDDLQVARAINRHALPGNALSWLVIVAPLVIVNVVYLFYLIRNHSPGLGTLALLTPLVLLLVILLYAHKHSWHDDDQLAARQFQLTHAITGTVAVLLCVLLPFVFLVKISPATPPSEGLGWAIATAVPRWFHLLLMSVAIASLVMAWRLGETEGPLAGKMKSHSAHDVRRRILRLALFALVLEFVLGPAVLMTMRYQFMSVPMGVFLALGMLCSVTAMVMLSASVNNSAVKLGRFLPHTTALLLIALLATALTRHLYRDQAVLQGGLLTQATLTLDPDDDPSIIAMPGRTLYLNNCKACHDNPALAPSLGEIESIYQGNPDGIVQWAKHPGKKRAQYGPMPPMGYLHTQPLNLIADFMLASGKLRNDREKPTTKP